MDPTAIDPNWTGEDDGPRVTHGLAEAEKRLAICASVIESSQGERIDPKRMPWPSSRAMAADIRLVLSELNGLKQFDPR